MVLPKIVWFYISFFPFLRMLVPLSWKFEYNNLFCNNFKFLFSDEWAAHQVTHRTRWKPKTLICNYCQWFEDLWWRMTGDSMFHVKSLVTVWWLSSADDPMTSLRGPGLGWWPQLGGKNGGGPVAAAVSAHGPSFLAKALRYLLLTYLLLIVLLNLLLTNPPLIYILSTTYVTTLSTSYGMHYILLMVL